jgi:hypothetical protein
MSNDNYYNETTAAYHVVETMADRKLSFDEAKEFVINKQE